MGAKAKGLNRGVSPARWLATPVAAGAYFMNEESHMRKNLLLAVGAAFLFGSGAASAADPEAGAKVFKKCAACHTLEQGKKKVGPSLFGIIGRKAGGMEGFNYSKQMRESGVTWDEATLNKYLEDPKGYIKGNRMSFAGLKKPADREDVIAYLKENAK
jgi:cytochrome c